MTVLKCDRCGVAQKDPKDLKGWVEATITVYATRDDCKHYHEHWCSKCHKEMARTRYAEDIERHRLLHQDPLGVYAFGSEGDV